MLIVKEEMKQATIRQHYYPESGWGWVVVFVAFLVQVKPFSLWLQDYVKSQPVIFNDPF